MRLTQLMVPASIALAVAGLPDSASLAQEVAAQSSPLPADDELVPFIQEDPQRAIALLEPEIAAARKSVAFPTRRDQARLDAVGLAYVLTERWAQADAAYAEVESSWEQSGKTSAAELAEIRAGMVELRTVLGNRLLDSGDFAGAEIFWRRLAASGRATLDGGDPEGIYPILQLGKALTFQGRLDEAEALVRDTLALATQRLGEDAPYRLIALNNLAGILDFQFRREEALVLLREAAERGVRTLGPDAEATLMFRDGLGANLMAQRAFDEAEPIILDTVTRTKAVLGDNAGPTLRAENTLALLFQQTGRLDEARAVFERIIPAMGRLYAPDHPEMVTLQQNYAALRMVDVERADSWSAQDRLAVLATARDAVRLLRERRGATFSAATGTAVSRELTLLERGQFHTLVAADFTALGTPGTNQIRLMNEAFIAAQESMDSPASAAIARSTARALANREGPEILARFDRIDALGEQYRALQIERDALVTRAAVARPRRAVAIESELAAIEAETRELRDRMRTDFPAFTDLVSPTPLSLLDANKMLEGSDDAVVLILPTYLGTHVFAISGSGVAWGRSDLSDTGVAEHVQRLLWDVGASVAVDAADEARWLEEGEGAYPFDRTTAHELYKQLFPPVAERISGARQLYVVATGSLSSLPLGMLVTEKPQGADGDPAALRATNWFADSHALIQMPSLQSLAFLREHGAAKGARGDGFLGFGDPVLSGEAETRGGGVASRGAGGPVRALGFDVVFENANSTRSDVDPEALRRLSNLPGTARELEEMRSVLGAPASSIITGAAATETAVKNAALSDAAIVTFATHGLIAGEVDGVSEPGLVFTPPTTATALDDGLLTMSEISGLDMNADWVILSACNTAAGDGSLGAPALSGLAKSFFLAGADSLLATHWPVRDDVAARLTVRTIAIARANPALTKAQALQAAMREIRDDPAADSKTDTWAHPNAWAPFTLIGGASGE